MSEMSLDDLAAGKVPEPDAPVAPSEPAPAPAEAAPVGNGHAEPDLEELLRQYDAEANPAPTADEPAAQAEQPFDPVLLEQQRQQEQVSLDERVQQRLAQIQQQQLFEHADRVGNQIKAAVYDRYKDSHVVDKELTDSWIEREANNDPQIKQAFINALLAPHAKGDRWGRTNEQIFGLHYNALLRRLDDRLAPQKRDNVALNEDRRAVVDAVLRGSRGGHAPEEPPIEWGQLTDQEFRLEKRKLGLGD
jgi:hypothetical protein